MISDLDEVLCWVYFIPWTIPLIWLDLGGTWILLSFAPPMPASWNCLVTRATSPALPTPALTAFFPLHTGEPDLRKRL